MRRGKGGQVQVGEASSPDVTCHPIILHRRAVALVRAHFTALKHTEKVVLQVSKLSLCACALPLCERASQNKLGKRRHGSD